MNTYFLCLKTLNEREGKETKGNISPSFPPFRSFLFTPKTRGKGGEGKIFNSSLPSPPSPLIIYPNRVSANLLPFLPFPSITFPSLSLPSPSLSQCKQYDIPYLSSYETNHHAPSDLILANFSLVQILNDA